MSEPTDSADLSGLLPEPGEQVPRGLRILAAAQNLGTLRSTHRPATRLAAFSSRNGRIYVFDQGIVIGVAAGTNPGGRFALFRSGQYTARKLGRGYLLQASDGRRIAVHRKWENFAALEQAITAGAAADG